MSVTSIDKNVDELTMTVVAEFDATPYRCGNVTTRTKPRALVGTTFSSRHFQDTRHPTPG